MQNEIKNINNIIPLGNKWVSMPIGGMSRIGVLFELLPNGKRPPKYTAQLFAIICEKIQKSSLYGEGEQIEIETSVRELAQELTPFGAVKRICEKTIHNGLQWLINNDWIEYDPGTSQGDRSVIRINLEKVKEYVAPTDVDALFSYDNQQQEWVKIRAQLRK